MHFNDPLGVELELDAVVKRMDALEVQINGITELLAKMHIELHAHLGGEDQDADPV